MDDPKSIKQSTLITQLQDVESPKRLLAILNAKTIQEPNPSLTRAIELLALSDPDKSVQQAAIDLLAEPQFQSAQRSLTSLPVAVREKLFTELVRWERDGLIFAGQANILKGRMATEPIHWKQPTPIKQPEANVAATAFDPPNPQVTALTASNQAVRGDTRQERSEFSLSKLLLSETSIRIALFLGAFFVLASAIILMALVEVARLPILGVTTLGFYAGAASLKRRLPLASFVLFLVGTFLLPIDMAVIGSLVRLSDRWLVWSITAGLVGTLFLFGIFWYNSKLLPILAYLAYALALAIPALAAEFDLEWAFFLQVLLGMAGAMFSYLIYRWKSLRIFLPFFQFIQVLLLLEVMADVLLLLLVFIIPYRETDLRLPAAACFAFQGLAFSICDWINARVQSKPQIYLAFSMACFTVFPPVLALRFIPDRILWLTLVCAFGAVLSVLGEVIDEKSPDHLSFLARPFFGAGFLLFVISTIWQSTQDARFATGFLAGIAALYLAIGIRRRQWLLSSLGLLSAYLGYLQVFQIPALQERGIFLGAIHLPPAIILLSIGLFFFWRKGSRKWWIVPVQLGFISGLITVFYTLINGVDMPNTAGVIFLIITIYLALISVVFRWTYLTAGATFCLAISVLFFVRPWENPAWLLPLTSLGLLYYLCGAGLNRRSLTRPWSAILQISGLFLIAALALIQFAVFQPGAYLLYLLLTAIVGWEAYTHRLQQALLPALFLLAIAFGFLLFEKNIALENWGIYFTGQAALYFLAGWLLPAAYKPLKSWAVSLRLAGLALLGLVLVLNQGFPSSPRPGCPVPAWRRFWWLNRYFAARSWPLLLRYQSWRSPCLIS